MKNPVLFKISNAIIYIVTTYLITYACVIYSHNHSNSKLAEAVTYPASIIYQFLGDFKNKGVNVFLSGQIVKKSSLEVNQLQNSLYLFKIDVEHENLICVDLKSQARKVVFPLDESFRKFNSNTRFSIAIDSNLRRVYITEFIGAVNDAKGNKLWAYDFSGQLLYVQRYNFQFHHRLAIYGGLVYANVRRKISLDSSTEDYINDEGYVCLNSEGQVLNEFWLYDNIKELDSIMPINRLINNTSYKIDPFHVNDVEVALDIKQGGMIKNGDVFISVRHLSCIVQIRDNSIIRVISGSFNQQHDVDIVNENVLRIYNNNSARSYFNLSEWYSNVVTYNLETEEERTDFNELAMNSITEGQIQDVNNFVVIENQNEHELIVLDDDKIVFRGGVRYPNVENQNLYEILTWAPVLSYDPFKSIISN